MLTAAFDIARTLRLNGGFTFTRDHVLNPSEGFCVGRGSEGIVLSNSADVAEIATAVETVWNTGAAVGGWIDKETGLVYVDPVDVIADLSAALSLGKERGEIAIYDLGTRSEIRL